MKLFGRHRSLRRRCHQYRPSRPGERLRPFFDIYDGFLKALERPVEHALGNHDLAGISDPPNPTANPRELAMRRLGIVEPYRPSMSVTIA